VSAVALVTGASSGIGRALARALAREGALLALVGRRPEALDGVGAERVERYRADLAVDADIEQLAARVGEDFGRLDLLIHSAGAISLGPLESAPVEDLDRQYRVNVRGPYALTQALLPAIKSSRGQVVFVNSSAMFSARAGVGAYAATKAALKALADSLRDEVNGDGVRVLSVFPGRTASPMQEALHEAQGQDYRPERLLQPDDVATAVISALRQPRTAEVTDISIRPFLKS